MKRGGGTRRALSTILRVALVGAIVLVVANPNLASGTQTPDTASITTFAATMDLHADGRLDLDEKLAVDMPYGKHGIFRIFDTADPRRREIEHSVVVHDVERDGGSEPYSTVSGAAGTSNIKIGSVDTLLTPGRHDYTVKSSTENVFEPGKPGEAYWWWDVVGSGWQMSMTSVDITVHLPSAPLRVACVQAKDTPCQATLDGTTMHISTGPLEPFTPVTVQVAFPKSAVTIADDHIGRTIALSIVAALIGAALAFALFRATREKTPGLPVLFEPPEGVSPALGVLILDEAQSSAELQATLFDLAARGALRLEGDNDSWVIHLVGDPASGHLDPAEALLLSSFGLHAIGDQFVVSKSVASGQVISVVRKTLALQVKGQADPYLQPSSIGCAAALSGWLSAIAIGFLVKHFVDTRIAWWPLLIGLAAFSFGVMHLMFETGVMTKRTTEGRDLWSRVGGFARFLTTDSSESRFDAAAHLDWYPRYLAWAVAFGVADEWERRFQAQGVTVPQVPWLLWTGPYGGGFSVSDMSRSFDSTIASASAAYAATQSSSGGGGGGSW